MSQIGCSFQSPGWLSSMRWCPNGSLVGPYLPGWFADYTNRILRHRPKCVYSGGGNVQDILGASDFSSVTRTRARFACHSSTHTKGMWVVILYARPDTALEIGVVEDPRIRVTLTDGGSYTETVEVHCGLNIGPGLPPTDMPSEWGSSGLMHIPDVPKDTALFGQIEDVENARLICACVFENPEECDTANGYFSASGYSVGSPIYDEDREGVMVALTNAWHSNAAHCFNWHVDNFDSPRTRTSATAVNALDGSSTTFTSSIPGWSLDLSYKESLSSGGVPVVFKAYASQASGTGTITLRDSAGTVKATLSPNSATPQWWSTTALLDADEDRYFIMYAGSGAAAITLSAASLYEYLTPP